ncbi:MAG TPA: hypothetical protein VGB32_08840 [Candidatus Bathyarchaeia archaeon]
MSEQQGPQNSIQFIVMLVKAFVTGVPKMIKTIIITVVISGMFTLGLHFYLILVPNDGFNSSGNPILDSILVLADVNPTPPNVLLFWFLLNFLFWWIIGVFREKGIIGGIKQFVTTPIFVAKSLRDAGLGAFPMLMAGLAFAFTMRLTILGTMTTLQMFLMTIGVLVSQTDSIVLIGLQLGFKDVKGLVSRGQPVQLPGAALPATMVLGAVLGFAYLVYFPFNTLMAQALVALMVIGLIVLFVRGRKSGGVNTLAMALMLLCVFTVAAQPALADDGGAAESGGAMNVINNPTLRDFMISQGINPALAGIAASLFAQGRLTKGLFDKLKSGKLDYSGLSNREFDTMRGIRTKLLTNLQHMEHEIWFGKAQKLWKGEGEPGNVRAHIDKLIDDLIHGKSVDLNKYGQIYTVYTGHVTGRTITEDMIPTSNQLWRETISDGVAWTTREIVTGRTIDGETSYMSFALRGLLGIATGGGSEYVYVPANSLYTMKNYVDRGGSSILGGFLAGGGEAIFQWGVGRVIGGGLNLAGRGLGRVGGYLATKFPNAAKGVSGAFTKINNVLNTKITWPGKGATPRVPGAPGVNQINKIMGQVKQKQATGSPYPGIKNPTFTNAGKPPDLRGMTQRDVKALRVVMDKHGAQAQMRPTTKYARAHLEKGTAVPKSELIKNKTINDIDSKHLGFPGGDQRGLAACRKPNPLPASKPPDMSKAQWRELRTRHAQRSMEFRDQANHLTKLEGQGKITWDRRTGIIYDKATGKPFTGDNDAFSFTDAVTGKPVSPFTNQQINQDLQKLGVTQHNEHLGWDYGNLPKTPGAGGAQSKFQTAQGIDNKILTGHGPGGEPLNTYNPLNFNERQGYGAENGWSTSYWTGGTR